MIIEGQYVTNEVELEIAISNLGESSKVMLRNMFYGTPQPASTQKDLDYQKYLKRASVKDQILAEMASENMERVRNGVWTVPQLIALTQDVELKLVLDDIATLSFELAQSKLNAATNPMITSDIKTQWITKLQNNLFNS
jgi:hypothetical protein